MSQSKRLLVVVAAGPLIGAGVAGLFASNGFTHVALLARNKQRLEEADIKAVLSSLGGKQEVTIKAYEADVTVPESLIRALKLTEVELGAPEVVLYNGTRISTVSFKNRDNWSEDDLITDLKISTVGLYTTAKWAFPLLIGKASASKPTFLVTGGYLHNNPEPDMFSLSLNKAAQYNLAISLAKEFEPKGVHVGVVVVGGVVTPQEPYYNPKNISERYWRLYSQKRTEWTREIDMVAEEHELGTKP